MTLNIGVSVILAIRMLWVAHRKDPHINHIFKRKEEKPIQNQQIKIYLRW